MCSLSFGPGLSVRTLSSEAIAAVEKISTEGKTKKSKDKKGKKAEPKEASISYWEQKKAAKERRRDLHNKRQERVQRLKVRRFGRPQDEKKVAFNRFFIRKKVNDEFMDRKARQMGLEWQIRVAVILERIPVIQPDKEEWEIEYDNLRAHLNLFGKVYPKELIGNVAGFNDTPHEDAASSGRPMTDDEVLALLPFVPAPRETLADASGDVRTLDRKLKTNLFLVVQEQAEATWQFPTVAVEPNESLLAAAKRAVPHQVGEEVEFWCPSNAPWTVELVAFDAKEQQVKSCYGIKTFFIKVQHDEGNVSTADKTVHDFAWLDRQEMVDRVRLEQGDFLSQFYYYML